MKLPYYLIITVILLFAGCGKSDYTPLLSDAETLMSERPDSALELLQSIVPNSLNSPHLQARYALLYSQALDKNYIDVTNDSLIRKAVEYYKTKGSDNERLTSLYYLGRVQENAGDLSSAMISYIQAREYADKIGDHYQIGLLYTQIANIYCRYYDYPNYLEAATHAYNHYCKTPLKVHQHYALLSIAAAYNHLNQPDKSLTTLEKLITMIKRGDDNSILHSCLSQKAMIMMSDAQETPQQIKKVILTIRDSLQSPLNMFDYTCLAYAYAAEGKNDSTDLCIMQATRLAKDRVEEAGVCYIKYRIATLQGDYKEAYSNMQKCFQVQDSVVRQTLMHSIMTAQRDYFQTQSNFRAYELKTNRQVMLLVVLIFSLLIFGLIFYINHRLKLKNMEINKYMSATYKIQNSLQDMSALNGHMNKLAQQLFENKFELIDQLGCTYYERQNTQTEQEVIFNAVKKAIDDLGSDKKTKQELELIINNCKDNAIEKIRQQLPKIKECDLDLLCYLSAGFSYRVISIFMQDKVENIYTRKSRLKTKIAQSEAPDKNAFLDLIG